MAATFQTAKPPMATPWFSAAIWSASKVTVWAARGMRRARSSPGSTQAAAPREMADPPEAPVDEVFGGIGDDARPRGFAERGVGSMVPPNAPQTG